jgi:hypothetical protein
MAYEAFAGRFKRTPEQEAKQVADAKAARVERKTKKEEQTKQNLEAVRQLFLTFVEPRVKAHACLFKGDMHSEIGPQRFLASCRSMTKQGRLDVQLILEVEDDGTLTLTIEAVQQNSNPLSKRTCLPIAGKQVIIQWIEEQLGECVKIQAYLEK